MYRTHREQVALEILRLQHGKWTTEGKVKELLSLEYLRRRPTLRAKNVLAFL